MATTAKRKRSASGGLDRVLGPLLSGVVLVVALAYSLLDRRAPRPPTPDQG